MTLILSYNDTDDTEDINEDSDTDTYDDTYDDTYNDTYVDTDEVYRYFSSYLEQHYRVYGQDTYVAYYDLNHDEIDEMIVSYGTCNADWKNDVLYYSNGKVKLAGTFFRPAALYESSDGEGIYAVYSIQGFQTITYVTMSEDGTEIEDTSISSDDDDGTLYSEYDSIELTPAFEDDTDEDY